MCKSLTLPPSVSVLYTTLESSLVLRESTGFLTCSTYVISRHVWGGGRCGEGSVRRQGLTEPSYYKR